MNRATLIGRIGRDPETRTTQSGSKVVSFSLATSERWKDKSTGESKEKTEWHNIVVWNENICRIVEAYCKKGSQILVEGQIQYRKYTDKDGNERNITEIVLQGFNGLVKLLDGKGSDSKQDTHAQQGMNVSLGDQLDDQIPFAPEWR